MEKFREAMESIGERLRNPFFFSYILSWLVLNWEVCICLFWYDKEILWKTGYITQVDYISSRLNSSTTIWWPLIGAICYTLGSPLLKNLVTAFRTWMNKWGENWRLNLSMGAKIPIERYLARVKLVEARERQLELRIESESTAIMEKENQLAQLTLEHTQKERDLNDKNIRREELIYTQTQQISNLRNDLNSCTTRVNAFEGAGLVTPMLGDWKVSFDKDEWYDWRINDVYEVEHLRFDNSRVKIAKISNLDWNEFKGEKVTIFLKFDKSIRLAEFGLLTHWVTFELNRSPANDRLVGMWNENRKVVFKRV